LHSIKGDLAEQRFALRTGSRSIAQVSGRTLLPVVKFVGRNPVAALQLAGGEPADGDRQP
jgi:hypothetical protein